MSIKLVPNSDGKYVLLDQQGKKAYFTHPVDANEALTLLDEKGEHRYTAPKSSISKRQRVTVKEPEDVEDVEELDDIVDEDLPKTKVKNKNQKEK